MKKKILIAYATAGVGHKKAALAVNEALKQISGDFEVKLIDVLDYSIPWFKKSYPELYLVLVNKTIWLWKILYYFTNNTIFHKINLPLRKFSHLQNCKPLYKFVKEYAPDVVISTHFIMPDICAYLKKEGMKMKVYNIVTDYRDHSFWISDGVDKYFVAHEDTKKDLVEKWGIDPKNVLITGIPVEPKFSIEQDKEKLKKKFGISLDQPCILVLSGGYGIGPLFQMIQQLDGLNIKMSVISICGHNEQLYKQIENDKTTLKNISLTNFRYVDNVDELMTVSDIYLGKAGGISSTEALVKGLPMILVRPIPGQESRNAELLVNAGVAVCVKSLSGIKDEVKKLMENKNIDQMKQKVKDIRKPFSSADIARLAVGE